MNGINRIERTCWSCVWELFDIFRHKHYDHHKLTHAPKHSDEDSQAYLHNLQIFHQPTSPLRKAFHPNFPHALQYDFVHPNSSVAQNFHQTFRNKAQKFSQVPVTRGFKAICFTGVFMRWKSQVLQLFCWVRRQRKIKSLDKKGNCIKKVARICGKVNKAWSVFCAGVRFLFWI